MSAKYSRPDHGEKDPAGTLYHRWFDGQTCCYKSCATVLTADQACVVIATDESKRKRLAKSKTPVISWVPHGRQVLHRSCFQKLETSANDLFSSRSEANLFHAGIETAEHYDGQSTIQNCAAETAKLFWSVAELGSDNKPQRPQSPVVVAFTGAGISASAGIPTYRGTDGIGTKSDMKHGSSSDDTTQEDEQTAYSKLEPTATHRHLATLEQQGWLSYVASQNCDNLHRKAGTTRDHITELHGNVFIEFCSDCHKEYERSYEVDAYSTDCYKESYYVKCCHCGFGHRTGRQCSARGCRGKLHDTIVNFGDPLHDSILGGLSKATGKFLAADVCLALGSSLSVSPANMLVTLPHFLVVVNLQSTDADGDADIRVWAESDQFMTYLMEELQKGPAKETPLVMQKKGGPGDKNWQELKEEIEYAQEQEIAQAATNKIATRRSQRKRKYG